jgi:hypothetical protein
LRRELSLWRACIQVWRSGRSIALFTSSVDGTVRRWKLDVASPVATPRGTLGRLRYERPSGRVQSELGLATDACLCATSVLN